MADAATAPRRIVVVGNSGAGKTTFAARIADQLGVPHIELDAIHHRAGWQEVPIEEFQAELVQKLDSACGGWVVDGNYELRARKIVWTQADVLIWIDPSKPRVMRQVITRTLGRMLRREKLWHGNRESVRTLFSRDSIVLWTWTHHAHYRTNYERMLRDPEAGEPPVIRLRSRSDIEQYLVSLR